MPTLKALAAQGTSALGAIPVYPSLTYPSHASMITGVMPVRHGIISNMKFSWQHGPTDAWYWESSCLRVPALWQVASAAGKTSALIRWPVSVGAHAEWVIPEIFGPRNGSIKSSVELTTRHSTHGLIEEIFGTLGWPGSDQERDYTLAWHDEWVTEAAIYILKKLQPDLTLIHLVQADKAQHDFGKDAPEVKRSVQNIDALLNELIRAINLELDCVLIVGDHGFIDFDKIININVLFEAKGWLRADPRQATLRDWRALAHVDGGQAAIYSKDRALNHEIVKLISENAGKLYQVVDRRQLDVLGSFPEALCAIDPAPGFTLSGRLTEDFITPVHRSKGQHGGLPTNSELAAGFVAAGAGIRHKARLSKIKLVDIGPTVAAILGIGFPISEGRVIDLF